MYPADSKTNVLLVSLSQWQQQGYVGSYEFLTLHYLLLHPINLPIFLPT